jgi:hypothetical protein
MVEYIADEPDPIQPVSKDTKHSHIMASNNFHYIVT